MLPLSDHNPSRTTPVVNYLLIAANVLMFFWELSLGPDIERRARGGLGIMLDDTAAAIYAVVLLLIGEGIFGVRP